MTNVLLYAVTVLFWGVSWLAIKFQLGVVAPEVSLVYRFALAAAIMVAFCLAARRPMRFSPAEHGFFALQGVLLFSTNYYLIYQGTQYLTSGLVAVIFSMVVVVNIAGGAFFFGAPVRPRVVAGALLGIGGMALIFGPEIQSSDLSQSTLLGAALCLAGTVAAALGMLTSARNQRHMLPVIQTNAYGMAYGAGFLVAFTVANESTYDFDPSVAYVGSLLFLAVFASVVAFWSYLTLVGRIGADRAGYATVLFPVVALGISTVYEGYLWTAEAALGVGLVLLGNALVLTRFSTLKSGGNSTGAPGA